MHLGAAFGPGAAAAEATCVVMLDFDNVVHFMLFI
jgi:hypothetical protein